MAVLYLVATPIGNLQDISLRALRVLADVGLIAAEDTRQTGKLLAHYQIQTPQTSYHEHNKLAKLSDLLEALGRGDVALVSDAGTPGLNDPGYELVQAALKAGHEVSPIPGASAPISALVVSGLPGDTFLYLGYLPRKRGERQRLLSQVAGFAYTLIFLETPHRLVDALADLQQSLGDRQVAVARELTKLHEEIMRGSLADVLAHYRAHPPRGEITLVVAGNRSAQPAWPEAQLRLCVRQQLAQHQPVKQIAADLAAVSGWPRREIYQIALAEAQPDHPPDIE